MYKDMITDFLDRYDNRFLDRYYHIYLEMIIFT